MEAGSFAGSMRRERRPLHPFDPAAAEVIGNGQRAEAGKPPVLLLPASPLPAATAETRMGEQRFGNELDDKGGKTFALRVHRGTIEQDQNKNNPENRSPAVLMWAGMADGDR